MALAIAACGGGASDSDDDGAETLVATSTDAVSTAPAPTVPFVSAAEVLSAVAAAPSISKLPDNLEPSLEDASGDTPYDLLGERGCLGSFTSTSIDLKKCLFGDPAGTTTVVVLGDSHASMWYPTLAELAERSNWKLYVLNKVSCGAADLPDPYLYQEDRRYSECIDWHQWAHTAIRKLNPQLVILTSLVNEHRTGRSNVMAPDHWRQAMEKTINELKTPTMKVAVLGDIPQMARKSADCLAAHMDDIQKCSTPAEEAIGADYDAAERTAAVNTQSAYLDVTPWFCSSTCTAIVANRIVYSDTQHMTVTYGRYLAGAMMEAFLPLLS